MYEFMTASDRRAVRKILQTVMRHSLIWPFALPLAFAVLFGILGALIGLNPVEYGLEFFAKALVSVSLAMVNLWTVCFLFAALLFGVGRNLPGYLQHRSLTWNAVALFTRAIALQAQCLNLIATLFDGPFHRLPLLIRPSRTGLCTASALAGAGSRLE